MLVECCFTSTETVGLLGTGAQDGHLDFHTAPKLCHKLRSFVRSFFLFNAQMLKSTLGTIYEVLYLANVFID